jgi:cysteine sulfinate desulfinase/cysteine desulfurase-like protein
MTRKHYSIDQLSTATSRQAQSEMAMMQSDLRKLRDSISNMSRSIHEPVIRASRKKTKKTTNASLFSLVLDGVGGVAAGNLLNELGVSTSSSSASQRMSSTLALLALGQRIR